MDERPKLKNDSINWAGRRRVRGTHQLLDILGGRSEMPEDPSRAKKSGWRKWKLHNWQGNCCSSGPIQRLTAWLSNCVCAMAETETHGPWLRCACSTRPGHHLMRTLARRFFSVCVCRMVLIRHWERAGRWQFSAQFFFGSCTHTWLIRSWHILLFLCEPIGWWPALFCSLPRGWWPLFAADILLFQRSESVSTL